MSIDATQFEYPHLKTVDPNFSTIDTDVYVLRPIKLDLGAWPERNPGEGATPYINGQFVVAKHDKFSGRKVFHTFKDITTKEGRGMKALRKMADATGVQQQDAETLQDYLQRVVQMSLEFKVPVSKVQKRKFNPETKEWQPVFDESVVDEQGNPTPQMENVINFRNAGPV